MGLSNPNFKTQSIVTTSSFDGNMSGYWGGWMPAQLPSTGTALPKMCPWCSGNLSFVFHNGICPKVASIEYYPDGSVKRVEFKQGHGDSL